MGIEQVPNDSERIDDVAKAEAMARGSDWQHSQAANMRAGGKGMVTEKEWEEGANSAEALAATEYDAESEAAAMSTEDLRQAVADSHAAAEAERSVNPKYDIGSKLDHLTRRAVAFAKEYERRRSSMPAEEPKSGGISGFFRGLGGK